MELYIFDTLLETNDIDFINSYCLNSLYKPEHKSDIDTTELDSRFSCTMSRDDLIKSNLIPSIERIATTLNTTVHVGHHYINHYSLMTNVAKHVDSSFSDFMTILVFPNKYWNREWGGEIAFYSEKSEQHTLVEYKPGRIIVFDSRIAHKVLPMNQSAKKDRYSIAIKCSTDIGLENFKKVFSDILTIRGNNV
jgi:Rps23 Pro-64 3,4-dihydroxylase Tpa1-like proline 4-hydroxylase